MNRELLSANDLPDFRRGRRDLAHETERAFGGIRVLPAARRLIAVDGKDLVVEPLVMQLLVTLSDRMGETLSRDDLVNACWGQRIVGDDAINRAVSHLRRDLAYISDGSVKVETIPRVGYRLVVDESVPCGGEELRRQAVAAPSSVSASRWGVLQIAVILLGIGLFSWALAGEKIRTLLASDVQTVAVAPLLAISDSPYEKALATGISEELINRLRRVSGLRVTSLTDTHPAGEDTEYFVRGTVQVDPNNIRVSARLEDTAGNVLWSDRFDRPKADLFFVQEEIASAVAHTLSVTLDVGIHSEKVDGTRNPDAFAAFHEARSMRHSPDRARYLQLLERAIALDPGYVRALFEMNNAQGLGLYRVASGPAEDRVLAKMDLYSQRAVDAAPDSWIGHASRSWYFMARKDFANAVREQDTAESLDPGNDPELYNSLANFHGHFGRSQRALAYMRARDPIDPIFREDPGASFALFFGGEYDEAISLFEKSRERKLPENYIQNYAAAWSYLMRGRREAARSLFEKLGIRHAIKILDGGTFDDEELPEYPRDKLERWANVKFGGTGRSALSDRGVWAAYLGKPELAVEYMRLAYKRPGIAGFNPLWHPAMAEARKTEAFAEFVSELGMAETWRNSGDWGDYCRPVSRTKISCE